MYGTHLTEIDTRASRMRFAEALVDDWMVPHAERRPSGSLWAPDNARGPFTSHPPLTRGASKFNAEAQCRQLCYWNYRIPAVDLDGQPGHIASSPGHIPMGRAHT